MPDLKMEQTFQTALRHHRAGRLQQAEALCHELIAQAPDHGDAIHLLGKIVFSRGDHNAAIELFRRAVACALASSEFHNSCGVALRALGKIDEAVAAYRQAIALKPDYAEALYNLGNCLSQQSQWDEAIACYRKSIALRPKIATSHFNLGTACQAKRLWEEAAACYRKAIELKPDYTEAHSNLGLSLQNQGKPSEAIVHHQKAVELNPRLVEAHHNLGSSLYDLGRLDEAIAAFRKALELQPNSVESLGNLGVALDEKKHYEEAVECQRKALQLRPNSPKSHCRLGTAVAHLGHITEAANCFRRAIELQPDFAEAHGNLGVVLQELGQLDEAQASFNRALELKPDYTEAHWNRGLLFLARGNFAQGWDEYEWRWRRKKFIVEQSPATRELADPRWDGSDLAGRTVLLHSEQGYGDSIQFIRYAPLVAARGGRVVLEVQGLAKSLFRTAAGITGMVSRGQRLPAFDCHLPFLSLPRVFGTTLETIPSQVPYLQADPARVQMWRSRLARDRARLRVGLVWAGRPSHSNDRNRSITLQALAPLAQVRGVTFYSLQKGAAVTQTKNPPAGMKLADLTAGIKDFADTAAFMENLDLVIAVDTSVVHLAGALGKPVWTLLPFMPDWRWLLDRDDTPWYPTMRLFRQRSTGDWPEVIERVRLALSDLAVKAPPRTTANRQPAPRSPAACAADFIPAGATVVDLDCGKMELEKHLPHGCRCVPCDSPNGQLPPLPDATHITLLDGLDRVADLGAFLKQLRVRNLPTIIGCKSDQPPRAELMTAVADAGWTLTVEQPLDQQHALLRLSPSPPAPLKTRRVLVLSCFQGTNFGDRLGYHLIHDVLPPHATVCHATCEPDRGFQPHNVPAEHFDLLVVGIGNNLSGSKFSDDLLQLIQKAPKAIGIFGTQYRESIDPRGMSALLDRLHLWFARHEEDVLLFGKGRNNVAHLGDWLITAFPLSHWTVPKTLLIGEDISKDLALDRSIQKIQSFRRVSSARLSPLLCALCSADEVAYCDEREMGTRRPSGKFRSLLLDVFGRTFPEEGFFTVNRAAVAAYKQKVEAGKARLRDTLARLLEA